MVFYVECFAVCELFNRERPDYINEMLRMEWLYIRGFLDFYFNPLKAETLR
jgi:hypothetical protein